MRDNLYYIKRLVERFQGNTKMLLGYIVLKSGLEVVVSFFVILFSHDIISMMEKSYDMNNLLRYAMSFLVLMVTIEILLQILNKHIQTKKRFLLELQNRSINDRSMDMDYEKLEQAEVQNLRREQDEFTNMTGGLYKMLIEIVESGFKAFISIIVSLYFIFSVTNVKEGDILNDYMICILLVILVGVLLNNKMLKKINISTQEYMKQCLEGNRLSIYYLFNILFGYEKAKDLRIFNQQFFVLNGIQKAINIFCVAGKKYVKENRKKQYISQTLFVISSGVIYLLAGIQAYKGLIEISDVIIIAGAIMSFTNGFNQIGKLYADIIQLSYYAKSYVEYLEISKKSGELPMEESDNIEFKLINVSFRYPNSEDYALHNINMTIRKGDKIAVVGKNGSGKTTLIKLLCRLYDVTEGVIELNGVDIREYQYDSYISWFASVFQDFILFSFPICENIALAEQCEEESLREVLKKVGATERIYACRAGIHTYIGRDFDDEGVDFSGGERQKIAIARCIYKGAPVIIMDEPTAALDPVSECEVFENFNAIVTFETAIYISHRLASCKFCKNVFVLDKGEIVQIGSHDRLVAEEGIYREMWEAQAQYYM